MDPDTYTYTLINTPLPSSSVSVSQINNIGQVIGTVYSSNSPPTPFLYDGGVYTSLAVSGAYSTTVTQLNNLGQVIGRYTDSNGTHSFLYQDGDISEVNAPGAIFTTALQSSSSGILLGTYFDGSGLHPFIDDSGNYTVLSVPGATSTYVSSSSLPITSGMSINDAGQALGTYTDDTGTHPFLYSDGIYTTLSEPGATSITAIQINDAGQVIGTFNDASGTHSFEYDNGTYTTIAVPGATTTSVRQINDNGQIAGTYTDKSGTHVFLDTNGTFVTADPAPTASVGVSASFSLLDNAGDVLGNLYSPSRSGPFLYSNGTAAFISVAGAPSSSFNAINDLGKLIGTFSDGLTTRAVLATPVGAELANPPSAMMPSMDPTAISQTMAGIPSDDLVQALYPLHVT